MVVLAGESLATGRTLRVGVDCAHREEKVSFWASDTSLAEPRDRQDHVPENCLLGR